MAATRPRFTTRTVIKVTTEAPYLRQNIHPMLNSVPPTTPHTNTMGQLLTTSDM